MKTIISQNKESGYTIVELFVVLASLLSLVVSLAILGGLAYIAWHFVSKFW